MSKEEPTGHAGIDSINKPMSDLTEEEMRLQERFFRSIVRILPRGRKGDGVLRMTITSPDGESATIDRVTIEKAKVLLAHISLERAKRAAKAEGASQ